jgi:hypothetical protein
MGLLEDAPVRKRSDGKFLRLYRSLDADDQAMIRRWDDDELFPTSEIWRRLAQHFDIGRSSVERGLAELRENQWEA